MRVFAAPLALTIGSGLLAQGVTLTELATISLSSTANPANLEFIGSNPGCVAWNGTDLFVAGYNNSPNALTVAITRITGALSPTPVIGPAFGQATAPSFRGYTGLDIAGGLLVSSYDDGGSNPAGVVARDLAGAVQWTKTTRGSSGAGIDPGFGGVDAGVGWTNFGATGRALQDSAAGFDVYTLANGMLINPAALPAGGTYWRDMDFDDRTGDVWLRKSNKVVAATRVAGNATVNPRVVVDTQQADFVGFQNICVVHADEGSVVLYNDRPGSGPSQFHDQVIQAVRLDGTPDTIDWGAFAPNSGNGAFDFSYDEASRTLALLDFVNRAVTIFQVAVTAHWEYGPTCVGDGGFAPLLEATGSALPGTGSVTYTISEAFGGSTAWIFFGFDRTDVPLQPLLPPGSVSPCNVLIAPILPFQFGPLILSGSGPGTGTATATLNIPPTGPSGLNLTAQAAIIEASTLNFLTTNAVWLLVP